MLIKFKNWLDLQKKRIHFNASKNKNYISFK